MCRSAIQGGWPPPANDAAGFRQVLAGGFLAAEFTKTSRPANHCLARNNLGKLIRLCGLCHAPISFCSTTVVASMTVVRAVSLEKTGPAMTGSGQPQSEPLVDKELKSAPPEQTWKYDAQNRVRLHYPPPERASHRTIRARVPLPPNELPPRAESESPSGSAFFCAHSERPWPVSAGPIRGLP
jgi:hypothetical protein